MRLKWQRRIKKQLRRMRGYERVLAARVATLERQGLPLIEVLRVVMLDPTESHSDRAAVASMLSVSGDDQAVQALLKLFLEQTEKNDLYNTALTLESLNDRRAVRPLIHALLEDDNSHRRQAAARALGWISRPGRAAALALARCLADPMQLQPAREEAAESLAYVGTRETIEPLNSVLGDPDVRIRFWAVFALGGQGHQSVRTVQALESMLEDCDAPPGNWWAVGKEALAMLAAMQPPVADYKARLIQETERILSDPNATAEDHRWAVTYG